MVRIKCSFRFGLSLRQIVAITIFSFFKFFVKKYYPDLRINKFNFRNAGDDHRAQSSKEGAGQTVGDPTNPRPDNISG